MTPEQFTYWLNGFVEMNPDDVMISPIQWKILKDHLKLVMDKQTPYRFPQSPKIGIGQTISPIQTPSMWPPQSGPIC